MPRVIALDDASAISLEECIDSIAARGFDPGDEESLLGAARDLKRLCNDREFLGDRLVADLARRCPVDETTSDYGPQVVVLCPARGTFFMRANIWPSPVEAMFRDSGGDAFAIGLPHDHNFSFLTAGYFGPGYWSDYYEYDYETVSGYRGEKVDLRFIERSRLEEGKVQLYRAHRDVHVQHPAEALSVSLNVMHMRADQGWYDQYRFDIERGEIAGIIGQGPAETLLRVAVACGTPGALDLAAGFGRSHPSDRMRLAAWESLALTEPDAGARDEVWRQAERSGNRMVAGEARRRRAMLGGKIW